MSLDERLERARADYRALPVPMPSGATGEGRAGSARALRRRGPMLAAAAVVVALVGGAVAWGATRPDDAAPEDRRVQAGDPTSTTEPTTTTSTQVDPGAPGITLDPPGPYTDGREVTLSVAPGLGIDLYNGIAQCTTIEAAGGPMASCESAAGSDPSATQVTVRVRRVGLSVDGVRDCADAGVDCRFVVTTDEGEQLRSDRLTFVGPAPSPGPSLQVSNAGAGRFELRPQGLAVDPSWSSYRDRYPDQAAENGPFGLQVCATADSFPQTPDPYGVDRDLWGQGHGGPGQTCLYLPEGSAAIDPDAPDDPVTVTLPRPWHSYGGWVDCATDRCWFVVRRNRVTYADGTTSGWDDAAVAAALLPDEASWPPARRPSLTVDSPGPHRAGEEITITIAGLEDGDVRAVGFCRVDGPWGCGYQLPGFTNGTHRYRLPPQAEGCGPDECFLELDGEGEGLAPLATAPLDTP